MSHHKFIPIDYVGVSAEDATADTSYDLGTVFYNEAKKKVFLLGNTSGTHRNYVISASGQNTTLVTGVQFSTDDNTYAAYVSVGVDLHQISTPIYCKFTCPEGITNGSGIFLIRVDEE